MQPLWLHVGCNWQYIHQSVSLIHKRLFSQERIDILSAIIFDKCFVAFLSTFLVGSFARPFSEGRLRFSDAFRRRDRFQNRKVQRGMCGRSVAHALLAFGVACVGHRPVAATTNCGSGDVNAAFYGEIGLNPDLAFSFYAASDGRCARPRTFPKLAQKWPFKRLGVWALLDASRDPHASCAHGP